jgi:hypothetical protein
MTNDVEAAILPGVSAPVEPVRAPRWLWWAGIVLFAWGVVIDVAGRDFGEHWDEWYAQVGVTNEIASLSAFPNEFTYHWVYFDLAMLPVLPAVVKAAPRIINEIGRAPTRPLDLTKYPAAVAFQKQQTDYVNSYRYILHTRVLYAVVTHLLVFLMLFAMTRLLLRPLMGQAQPGWAAIVSVLMTGVVVTSYEFSYHARYIAVDSIMAMITIAMFAAATRALHGTTPFQRQLWWSVTGVLGGLAFGCKSTGLVYCVPIGVCAFFFPEERTWSGRFRRLGNVAMWFIIGAYFSTPGAFRQPFHVWGGVAHTAKTYVDGKFGYRVDGFLDMLVKLPRYIFLYAPTPWPWLSAPVAAVMFYGSYRWYKVARRTFWFFATFLFAYLGLMLVGGQIQVRNALSVFVVFMMAAGFGVHALIARGGWVRMVTMITLVVVIIANAGYGVHVVQTVQNTTATSIRIDTRTWLAEHTDRPMLLSPKLFAEVETAIVPAMTCGEALGTQTPPADARVGLFFDEHPRKRWQAHEPEFYEQQFNSKETNLIFYPNWRANHYHDRTVVLGLPSAIRNGMDLTTFRLCTRTSTP